MNRRTLIAFFILTFAISWGILLLFLGFRDHAIRWFGEIGYTNPLFILAVYAPAISALGLVLWHHGPSGLALLLRRLLMWRMPAAVWLGLLVGLPLVFYAGALLKGSLGAPLAVEPGWGLVTALLAALLIGPVEEIGWRGLALPLLQREMAPFWAALWLGAVWGLWHVPAFFLGGTPQSTWSLPGFMLGCVAMSIILTPMFNASGGSLLVAALFHFQVNGPAWPDAQPWDSVILAVVAVVMVLALRNHFFRRHAGVTEVLADAVRRDG